MNAKIQKLIESGKRVILDCALENGAIVAANSSKKYFPKEAKYYGYVWPRDAAFTCVAADILGTRHVPEAFFDWCLTRAEGFKKSGVFYQNYFVNGPKALGRFQPDQTGSVLWAVWHHFKEDLDEASQYEELFRVTAEGLCKRWDVDHFCEITNDLWEERLTFPDLKDNFTYSLAACIKGLECAHSVVPDKRWIKVAGLMRKRLEKHCEGIFFRSYGRISDKRIDASLLGLAYPFEVVKPDDARMTTTVNEIEKKLVVNGGVHRYEYDEYDGCTIEMTDRRKGAGAWPLLNFWLSIYYAKRGEREKAFRSFNWVVDRVDEYIPEQIFENDIQVSVCPLCWSHAMFVIASKELGFLR